MPQVTPEAQGLINQLKTSTDPKVKDEARTKLMREHGFGADHIGELMKDRPLTSNPEAIKDQTIAPVGRTEDGKPLAEGTAPATTETPPPAAPNPDDRFAPANRQFNEAEQRVVDQALKGELPLSRVPADMQGTVQYMKHQAQVKQLDDAFNATMLEMHRKPTGDARKRAWADLEKMPKTIDVGNGKEVPHPEYERKLKEYDALPHDRRYQAELDDQRAVRQEALNQHKQELEQQARAELNNHPMPASADYNRGRAMAEADFYAKNPWLNSAPLAGAGLGALYGAVTADEENGTLPWWQRAAIGAGAGGALGYGVQHGAPMGAGVYHDLRTAQPAAHA